MLHRTLSRTLALASLLSTTLSQSNATSNLTISIPPADTYLLPSPFTSNSSLLFIDTSLPPSTPLSSLLSEASNATFISYSSEFLSLIGSNPSKRRIAGPQDSPFAYEAGVYVPRTNTVWFTGASPNSNLTFFEASRIVLAINLTNNELTVPRLTQPTPNANGGTYFNGKVYICYLGNYTYPAGVVSIDPITNQTQTVVNSYFGLRLNGPDDVTWTHGPKDVSKSGVMFFTDPDYATALNISGPPQLPNTVWRLDPSKNSLQPVISRADITIPNGIAASPDGTKLYVTDGPLSPLQSHGPGNTTGSAAVYVYDLDETLTPVNGRIFSLARTGVPDGIKVDRRGWVWTAEGEGIVVRDDTGRVLGVVNARSVLGQSEIGVANFALAGNRLIVLAVDQIWEITLAQEVSWEA